MSAASKKLIQTAGIPVKKDAFVIIVKTEWNAEVVDELVDGCVELLGNLGISSKVITVPGAFEIPFAILAYANGGAQKADAFIALGCVIKGDTPHFDYVCAGVTQGLMELNLKLAIPVINGVLTVNNQVQADERIGGRAGHKGKEAAVAALKMIALVDDISQTTL